MSKWVSKGEIFIQTYLNHVKRLKIIRALQDSAEETVQMNDYLIFIELLI